MPIPTLTASTRIPASSEKKPPVSRLARPKVENRSTSPIKTSIAPKPLPKLETTEPQKTTSQNTSTVSSRTTSRASSPNRKAPSSQSHNSASTTASRARPTPTGHLRQRSTALPTFNPPVSKFGHSRSASVITTSATLSNPETRPAIIRPRIATAKPAPRSFTANDNESSITINSSTRAPTTTSDTEAARNELEQLLILHESSQVNLQAFLNSVKGRVKSKADKLESVYRANEKVEHSHSIAINLQALDDWLQSLGLQNASQSIQDLSTTINDVQTLEDMFTREDGLLSTFTSWRQRLLDDRIHIDEMDQEVDSSMTWNAQVLPDIQAFSYRIQSSLSTIANLPQALTNSVLGQTIADQNSLANSMLSQCAIMSELGNALIDDHERWLTSEIEAALQDLKADTRPIQQASWLVS